MISTHRPARTLLLTVLAAWPLSASAQNTPQQPQLPTARDLLRQIVPPVQQQPQQQQAQQPQQAQQFQGQQQLQPGQQFQSNQAIPQGVVTQFAPNTTNLAPTIGSHQIDRFAAIQQLQTDLKSDGNNLANWAILGELAHEVAVDLPEGQDDSYYKLSRQAYENAARLDPNNNGLKAAVQFARDQEANAASFDAQRRQGVNTYLDARRREMAANGVNPTLMVYESNSNTASTTNQPSGVPANQPYGQAAPTRTYRPFYNQQAQQPYSYNQYQNGFAPPPAPPAGAAATNPTATPTTLREFSRQLPGVLLNEGARAIGGNAATPAPR